MNDGPASYEEALAILAGLASLAAPAGGTVVADAGARLELDRDQSRLQLAEARYRALVEQIPAVTFIASLVGGVSEIYVSPQIESLLGFTQEQWISDPVLWFHQLHPEDRPVLTRAFAEACATGTPMRGMCRAFARDGRMVWVHGEARFVRDATGRPIFLQGIAFDVTEQQRALETRRLLLEEQARRADADRDRARLAGIFADLPAVVMIMRGPEHVIEFLNAKARELLGGEALGRRLLDVFPQLAGDVAAVLGRVLATGKAEEVKQYPFTDARSPGIRYFNYVAQPLTDVDGSVGGILTHAIDVTAEVTARNEREELVTELQRTLRYNEIFAGMLGHDLRNPLGAIMSGAQLALRRSSTEGVQKPLNRILSASERMSRMIEQLLDFTRIRVGRGIELQLDDVNLVDVCRHAMDELEDSHPEWHMNIVTQGNAWGRWDADRLLQVIGNLLSNGVKHGDASAPLTVRIDGRREDQVVVAVHNMGAVPPELMSSLFNPFRGSQYRRERARGLGLGLYISKEIVVAHHGSIDVSSDAHAGTTFEVKLPRYPDRAPTAGGT